MQFYLLIILIVVLDQYTKYAALTYLQNTRITIVNGYFDLSLVKNTGAAFGILQNYRNLLLVVTPIIIACMIYFIIKNKHKDKLLTFSIALIIGGAVGNFIDRIRLGYVVDFFDFKFWPVFNLADSCVVVGTILLAYVIIYPDIFAKKQEGSNG